MKVYRAGKDASRCLDCGACRELIACPGEEDCIGCGACVAACPYEARSLAPRESREELTLEIEGRPVGVPRGVTVLEALRLAGYAISSFPEGEGIFAPCRTGGCFSCAVEVEGEQRPACITGVREGIKISLRPGPTPLRIVQGFMGHTVGGVGTPYYLKGHRYIEAACFAAGCNFRCPQCQNWTTTYLSRGRPLTPGQAAYFMTLTRKKYGVDRMAISGGECTLNRRWLVEYIRELRALNPDREARLHVDTNGSLLTPDYIDELVAAGMTDIGIDLKSWHLETFCRITGLEDRTAAQRFKDTAWAAVAYIRSNHPQVFLGVGIPYNPRLISPEEVALMGREIAALDPGLQVCVLDYRPEFRRRDIPHPGPGEMLKIYHILKETGLRVVICQTPYGYIGP